MVKINVSEDLDAEIRARARQEPSLRGFAYTVPRLEDLGPALGAALTSYLRIGEEPQRVVVLPRQRLLQKRIVGRAWAPFPMWRLTPEQILVHTPTRLILAAIQSGRRLEVTSTPLDQIITMQLGTILLFSWFEWSWAIEGKLQTCKVYFNTVSDRIFRELQQSLSRIWVGSSQMQSIPYSQKFEQLESLPFKFRNIIPLRLLLPDEDLQMVVYRSGLREPRFVFLKRKTSPATALVLTSGQVLVAEEEPEMSEGHYGVIARYMPRQALNQAILDEWKEGLLLRTIFKVQDVEFEHRLQFELEAKPNLERLITLLKQPF